MIPTKDRPADLRETLISVARVLSDHRSLIVVDASMPSVARLNEWNIRRVVPTAVIERSPSGKSRQLNRALEIVGTFNQVPETIHLLDDDVSLDEHCLDSIEAFLQERPAVVGVCPRNVSDDYLHFSLAKWLVGLDSRRSGVLLRSVVNVPPRLSDHAYEVEWMPGNLMSVRGDALMRVGVDPEGWFYGDDVELSLRLAQLGSLFWVPHAKIRHRSSPNSRKAAEVVTLEMDQMRLKLAKDYPSRFSVPSLVRCVALQAIGSALIGVFSQSDDQRRRSRGHRDFLVRMAKGQLGAGEMVET